MEQKKKSKTNWAVSIGITLILLAIVLIIWFFLQGETKTTGEYPGAITSSSVTCESSEATYPFFTLDESTSKNTSVTVLFSDDSMKSISLIETLYYPDLESSTKSEAHNHAAMNTSFGAAGLGVDAFAANYSTMKDKMVMTLYAEAAEFNEVAAKYFLANGLNKKSTIDDFAEKYAEQGFDCVIDD